MKSDKNIIITGTSKGIGRALVQYFLEHNFNVIGCARSNTSIEDPNYNHFQCDLTDEYSIKDFFSFVKGKYKKMDALINNAGIASMNHSLLTPGSIVDKIFLTNFKSTFLFCREAAKIMSMNKFGRIINFSSVAVPLSIEGEAVYASSKAAVETLTKILAKEFSSMGITCNCIGPCPVETDLIKNIDENKIIKLMELQALKKYADIEDIINVINFFMSKKSGMITGQIIYLGGVF